MGKILHKINYTSGILLALTLLSGFILSSPLASADNSATNTVRVTVPISCNLASSTTTAHTATIDAGTYRNDIGESTITATCNDSGGFAIYAIGYSNDTHGNNTLINTTNSTQTIATGTATSGATSNWAMKLTAVTGTYEPTIESAFQNYTTIPTTYTKVASHDSVTDQTNGASFKSTYAAYIASTQYAGTYEGKVKYTLVHPSTHTTPNSRPALLDTGQNVNIKMKAVAAGVDTETYIENGNPSYIDRPYWNADSLIKSIQTASTLPANFEPSDVNTISLTTSEHPVYIYFDNTNDAGIMYVYSGEGIPVLNPDSSFFFNGLRSLSTAPAISSWDTSSATEMNAMFNSAGYDANFFSLDLSSWDTSSATNMAGMFGSTGTYAPAWSIGDLSSWNTSNVTSMSGMFANAGSSSTTFSLDLSSWDTSSVTDMSGMFGSAGRSATTFSLNLSGWDTSSVINMGSMFGGAGQEVSTTWSISGLSDWDTSNVTDMNAMFSGAGVSATSWSIGDLSGWDTSSVINMRSMFSGAGKSASTWSIGDLSGWDTSSVTDMIQMFATAGQSSTNWSIGDISGWDVSSVTKMWGMFEHAGYSATTFSLNLSGWDTSSVTDMSGMFSGAGYSATTWSVTIPQDNGNNIANTTSRMYGSTTSTSATPPSGKAFTLAQ